MFPRFVSLYKALIDFLLVRRQSIMADTPIRTGYYGNVSEGAHQAQRPLATRIVPCNVCKLYPSNLELTNSDANGTFCWPCRAQRLYMVVPVNAQNNNARVYHTIISDCEEVEARSPA